MYEQFNMIDPAPDEIAALETAQAPEQTPPEAEQPQSETEQATPATRYYDISEETARRAHEMMSMRDYPKNSATNEYRAAVDQAAALVASKKASVSPYYHEKLDGLLDRYARRLAEWTNAYNRNRASCPSILVSGGSNFPVKKKNKQNAREDSLWQEYKEIEAILDKIKSVGTGAVDLADPHAREILTEQLNAYQKSLDDAKAANAYYRKHKTLDGCPGIGPREREWLTRPGVFAKGDGSPLELYGCPFPPYELQSRRGYIKRVADRLAELDRLDAAKANPAESTKFDGGEIVRNATENRLQILFDDKPDEDTRAALKSNGFRWSPRFQAWQRQLTANAESAARRALGLN